MSDTMLVRIRPQNKREAHTILYEGKAYPFTRERGWHEVPTVVAELARAERMSDLGPDSPPVFDVKDTAAARAQVEAETFREDPAGTPEKPHVVKPSDLPLPDESAPAARRRPRF
jgi:hypothetical protein